MSHNKFIQTVELSDNSSTIYYSQNFQDSIVPWFQEDTKESVLYISVNEIKTLSEHIQNISDFKSYVDSEQQNNVLNSNVDEYKHICIFGNPEDVDDIMHSRIDDEFADRLSDNFISKFTIIEFCGAFKSVPDMNTVINKIYNKLSDKSSNSQIQIRLESSVKTEYSNEIRTLTRLVSDGYVPNTVISKPIMPVGLIYKKLNCMLYTPFSETVETTNTTDVNLHGNYDNLDDGYTKYSSFEN